MSACAPLTAPLCALIVALMVASPSAEAGTKRVALLVAHPFGGEGLLPLRYTANDLERMREVLASWGGFADDDVVISFGEDADTVSDGFVRAAERLRGYARNGDSTLFLFYYSGHAKEGELRLGGSRLSLADLRRLTEETGAGVRIAIVDACRSGSLTRLKGAQKGAPIELTIEEPTLQTGQVLITASSENEDAQESDDIQGSFFTHYFTSGLRGAADSNHDGRVTLAEAYTHAYTGTVLRTVGTHGGVQHPSYRFDLRGAGDVVLTELERPGSALVIPEAASGHFVIFQRERAIVVAELEKQAGAPELVLVTPGEYVVKKRERDHLRLARISVRQGETALVPIDRMERVAFADDYAKGAVVTLEEAVSGRLGVRLGAGLGGQAFLSAPARAEYFPGLGILTLQLDLENLVRRDVGARFDLGLGASGPLELQLRDPYLGELSYELSVSQLTAGAALTVSWPVHPRLTLAALARLGLIAITRTFADEALPPQSFSTLTPGVGLEASVRATDWLLFGLWARAHYMFFNSDHPQSLAYVDGALVVTLVLR